MVKRNVKRNNGKRNVKRNDGKLKHAPPDHNDIRKRSSAPRSGFSILSRLRYARRFLRATATIAMERSQRGVSFSSDTISL